MFPEGDLIESERFARKVLSASLNGIYIFDCRLGRNVFVNTQYTMITGYSCEDLKALGKQQFIQRYHPDDRSRVSDHMDTIVRSGDAVREIEYRFRTKDGRWIWCLSRDAVFSFDQNGTVSQIIGTFIDITERKSSERMLRESEHRYKELVQLASSAIIRWRSDGSITFFNDYAQTFFGYTHEEIIGKHVSIIVPQRESSGTDLSGLVQNILDHPARFVNNINENICRDGRRAWMAWTNTPIFDENGKVTEILTVGVDATERMQTQAALQQSEAQFRQLADAMPQLVWTANPDGKVDYYNLRHKEYGGMERMSGGTCHWHPVLHQDDETPTLNAWKHAVRTGETYRMEHRIKLAHGSYHWHLSRATPVRDSQGGIVKWFGTATDIDIVKQAEAELRTINETLEKGVAERTAIADMRTKQLQILTVELIEAEERERKRIAQLLHDDLQQMLASAKLQLETATDNISDNPGLENVGRILKESITKARRIAHELSPPVLKHTSLFASLEWLVSRFKEQFDLRVHLVHGEQHIENESLKIFLFRAVQELLFNVVKHANVNHARVVLSHTGGYLCLSVIDQGQGFNPDHLDGDPVRATGLGLRSLRERASYMGGRLVIDSAPGRGCRFTLTVPTDLIDVSDRNRRITDREHNPQTESVNLMHTGRLRVLFVDDHTLMRKGLIKMVANNPAIEVVGEAANGREAVEQVRYLKPDVVVMDVSMPKMNGIDATFMIKKNFPDVRVIGLSMFDEDTIAQQMQQAGAETSICKTAPSAELLKAIYGSPATASDRRPQKNPTDDFACITNNDASGQAGLIVGNIQRIPHATGNNVAVINDKKTK